MTIKANEAQAQYFSDDSPPKLKGIQNIISKFDGSIECPPEVIYLLQMLNNTYGLDNIGYMC